MLYHLIKSFIHSFIHSFVSSFVHSFSFIQSLIHSFIHSFSRFSRLSVTIKSFYIDSFFLHLRTMLILGPRFIYCCYHIYRVASIFRLFRAIQCVLIHLHDAQTKTALAVAHCSIATFARQTRRAPKREC